ncbi:hypothetical protein ACFQ46_02680 [Kineococcus sp. GCM10028916]|uniref:hypothetical protein n=1 Tax=Kineococcus sp. GCM10028916 TaxID=3273394 RepID=UPI00363C60CD
MASIVAVITSPLLLAGSSASALPADPVPSRCYSYTIYESVSGFASAEELMRANLENAQGNHQYLLDRAPVSNEDPSFDGFMAGSQGEVEGFSALLDAARRASFPRTGAPLRALDSDGQLIAEATFNAEIAKTRGTYALDSVTLPAPGHDPAHDCR